MLINCPICKSSSGYIKICTISYSKDRDELSELPTQKYLCVGCSSVVTSNDLKKG